MTPAAPTASQGLDPRLIVLPITLGQPNETIREWLER
jgi:hypothetical protein